MRSELLGLHVVYRMTGDIAGHQVRRKLDAGEFAADATGQRPNQQRLAKPRNTFQQHMSATDQRGQHIVDNRILSDHGLLQLIAQRLSQLAGTLPLLQLGGGFGCGLGK